VLWDALAPFFFPLGVPAAASGWSGRRREVRDRRELATAMAATSAAAKYRDNLPNEKVAKPAVDLGVVIDEERREHARAGGGRPRIEAQHERGKLTAFSFGLSASPEFPGGSVLPLPPTS